MNEGGGHSSLGQEPILVGTWITLQQAEIMLGHVREAGSTWPDVALYLHSCITAVRSVTLTLQKALAHEGGFPEWYEQKRAALATDAEMRYLLEARNHVLKRGALNLLHSYRLSYNGILRIEVRGVGPSGPDVWLPRSDNADAMVPVDWRKLEGFEFDVPLQFGPLADLPDPPEREVKEILREKIGWLRLLTLDAEERFDPESLTQRRRGLNDRCSPPSHTSDGALVAEPINETRIWYRSSPIGEQR